MLKRKNKIIVFLSGLLVLVSFFTFQVYAIGKISLRAPLIKYNGSKVTYQTSNMSKPYEMGLLLMNGQTTYCIEPKVSIPPSGHRNDYTESLNTGLDNDVVRKIQLASFYGYDYPSHKKDSFYLATQQMIWNYLGYGDVVYRDENGNRIDVSGEINIINSLINEYDKKPSFDGQTFYMKKGGSTSLIDFNNVLREFKVSYISTPFVNAKIRRGSSLSITVSNNNSTPDKATIKLVKKSSQGGNPQVYSSGKYQKTIGFSDSSSSSDGSSLNIESLVYLKIEGGIPTFPNCEDDNKNKQSQCHNMAKFNKGPCLDDETVENDYYRVICSENLIYGDNFQKSIKINAGEGFPYDISISGNRTCKGTFKVDEWIKNWNYYNNIINDQQKIYAEKYNLTIAAGGCPTTREVPYSCCKDGPVNPITGNATCISATCYRTYCNNPDMRESRYLGLVGEMNEAERTRDDADVEKQKLLNIKSAFELWTNDYKFEPNVKINIQEGNTSKNIIMVEEILDSDNNHNKDKSNIKFSRYINTCEFSDAKIAICESVDTTMYANWERYSYVETNYKLPHKYIKKDSNATIRSSDCQYCLDGGYKYYTNFETPTGNYDIKVTASNLGHKGKWKIIDTCEYHLDNLVKPPSEGDGSGGGRDPNYGRTFLYRPISLFDPFPNRVAGPNWFGRENLITNSASTLYNKIPEYVVELTPQDIQQIKKSNALMKNKNISNVYTEYVNNSKDADPKKPYKSYFIHTEFKKVFGGSTK